jgi:hypothetical protein
MLGVYLSRAMQYGRVEVADSAQQLAPAWDGLTSSDAHSHTDLRAPTRSKRGQESRGHRSREGQDSDQSLAPLTAIHRMSRRGTEVAAILYSMFRP